MSAPLFETPRLHVRKLAAEDMAAMHEVYGDPEAMRWVGDGRPLTREQCAGWIEVTRRNYESRGYGMSTLVECATGTVVGFCGLVHPGGQDCAELKYALKPEYWRKRVATEAAQGMLSYGHRRLCLSK